MRVLGAILLLALALGAAHAHEECLDGACLRCPGGEAAIAAPTAEPSATLAATWIVAPLAAAVPIAPRARHLPARAPPVAA